MGIYEDEGSDDGVVDGEVGVGMVAAASIRTGELSDGVGALLGAGVRLGGNGNG